MARPVCARGVAPKPATSTARCSSTATVLPSLQAMRSESALSVKSRLQEGVSDADLRKWIVGAAFGKPVIVVGASGPIERFRLKPAIGHAHDMLFTHMFAVRHPELAKITQAIAGTQGSRWNVRPTAPLKGEAPSTRHVREIDSSASFVRLVQAVMASV